MKLLSILALATAAIATTNTTNTEADANNMAINEQAEAQAPHAEAGAADVQHWWPKPPFHHKCRPGSYSCTWSRNGWRVCDWSGHWFGGYCPFNTECKKNWQNGATYCLPKQHHHH